MSARFVTAYYKPADGPVEKHRMYEVDYREAAAKWPEHWSLDAPKKGEVKDLTPRDPGSEPADEQQPPGGAERVPSGMGLPAGAKV